MWFWFTWLGFQILSVKMLQINLIYLSGDAHYREIMTWKQNTLCFALYRNQWMILTLSFRLSTMSGRYATRNQKNNIFGEFVERNSICQNSKAINHNLVETMVFYVINGKFYLNVTDSKFSLFDFILPSFSNAFLSLSYLCIN